MIDPQREINLIDQQLLLLRRVNEDLRSLSPFSSAAPPSPFGSPDENAEVMIISATSDIIGRKINGLKRDRNLWERTLKEKEPDQNEQA